MLNIEQILIAFDQLVNTMIYVKGDSWGYADETMSARAWRLREDHFKIYKVINFIFFWQKNHCQESYNSEILRKNLPREYQGK